MYYIDIRNKKLKKRRTKMTEEKQREVEEIYKSHIESNIFPSVFISKFDPANTNMWVYLNNEDRDNLLKKYQAEYFLKNPAQKKSEKETNKYQQKMVEAELYNESTDLINIFSD
jgi:hypothetical protein